MKRIHAFAAVLIAMSLLVLSVSANWQASPRGEASVTIDGKKITVDYGRPYAKGRKVVGELVPYDKVWRTGANKATHLITEADLVIGNLTVPKGTYTLFTLPSASGWKLIVNKKTGQWGIPYSYESDELGRVDMKVAKTSAPVEQFTITLTGAKNGGTLKLEWENTSAAVDFKVK
ncbi:MAG: DUF2911 domain-containing protein [Blastocatellia bacterium]